MGRDGGASRAGRADLSRVAVARRIPTALSAFLVGALLAVAPVGVAPAAGGMPQPAGPMLSVAVSNPWFSPNRDGVKDTTSVEVSVEAPATVDVSVLDATGAVVAAPATGLGVQAGTTAVVWDGRAADGTVVPDGAYTVDVHATDAAGAVAEATAPVHVDTRRPAFVWRGVTPEPVTSEQDVRFSWDATDQSPTLAVTLQVWGPLGVLASVPGLVRDAGWASVVWPPRYRNWAPYFPGPYRTRLVLTDLAGNVTRTAFLPWRVLRPVRATVWTGIRSAGGHVALTFDDCIWPAAWASILATLKATGVRATFFCPGIRVAMNPALARRTVAMGNAIGSHGWDHADFTALTPAQMLSRLRDDEAIWWKVARATPAPFFRPPYGAYDPTVLAEAGATGYARVMLWNVDPRDWTGIPASEIVQRVLSAVGPGDVVILHVLPTTAAALPAIIRGLGARRLSPVTLPRLFADAGLR